MGPGASGIFMSLNIKGKSDFYREMVVEFNDSNRNVTEHSVMLGDNASVLDPV